MPLPRTPVFWLLFWFSGGILLAYRLKPDLFSCGLLLLSVFLLLVPAYCKMGKKLPRFQALLIGLGFFVLGILTTAIRLPENKPGHFIHHWDREAGPIKVKLIKKLKASPWNQPYLAAVQRLQPPLYTGTVLLKISKEETEQLPEIGDQLTLWGKIEPIGPPLNPFQFDYKAYMQQNGVYGELLVQAGDLYSIERKRKKNSSFGFTRERMVKSLSESGMDPSAQSLFQALILGDRTGLEAGLYRSYQRAGAAHILAVSGLHIGILAGMLHWLLKPLGRSVRKPWPIILIILSGLWGYAALSGFSPSVVRASLLFSFLSCSQVLRHPGFSLHFLGLAGIFMLSINPFWLLHVGFQLSFAAVGSILVFYKPLMALWPWKKGFLKRPGSLLAVSIAAQAGVLPFSLYYFHQFPGIFLLSNLLLIPGLGVLLLLGFIMLGMTSLGWLPELFITCYGKLLSLMNAAVQRLGGMDAFFFENIRWDLAD